MIKQLLDGHGVVNSLVCRRIQFGLLKMYLYGMNIVNIPIILVFILKGKSIGIGFC